MICVSSRVEGVCLGKNWKPPHINLQLLGSLVLWFSNVYEVNIRLNLKRQADFPAHPVVWGVSYDIHGHLVALFSSKNCSSLDRIDSMNYNSKHQSTYRSHMKSLLCVNFNFRSKTFIGLGACIKIDFCSSTWCNDGF